MRTFPLHPSALNRIIHHNTHTLTVCIITLTLLLTAIPSPLTGAETFSEKGERLFVECENAISSRQYDLLREKADELRRLGLSHGDKEEEITGEALRLHALICVRDTSDFTLPMEALIKEAPVLKKTDPRIYQVVTRTISSYYQRIINDYSQALHYASERLAATRQTGNRNAEASALSTIASIYFQKQDASGWSYAVESYNLANELGDLSTRYVTSCNMANYLYNNAKFDEAMKYLQESKELAERAHLESEQSYLNSFFGDILSRLGKPDDAEKYYKLSLADTPETSNYDKIYSRLCYALFLVEHKRLHEALELLTTTSDMANKFKITIFWKEIYALTSRIYEEQGDYAKSLEFYKQYTAATLNLFSEQKEREFAILDLRNKVSEEERKNASQSLELMKRDRTIIILSAIGVLFLLICVAVLIYHRRKVADYKQIVARYLENARSERHLKEQLDAATIRQDEPRHGNMNDEKYSSLYQRLEKMMKEDRIYRDVSLSLDKTASMLATNRTYLSQVVNEKAGKSFSNYVNEYRLNEAVAILSDPDNDDSLKNISTGVGFTSPSNFYTLFRQKVGVPPSIFRSNVKNIENNILIHQNDNQN